ncbi:MAG: cation:proton antiporter [Phycisphaeraceae bacterium]
MAFDVAITVIGGVVLVIGLFSGWLRQSAVSEHMLALVAGVVLGPAVLGWLEPQRWGDERQMMELVARLTMAVGLMGVAMRLPPRFLRRHVPSMLVILGPVMLAMWLVGGGLTQAVLGVGWLAALLIGAALTPTDPVLASAIVVGPFAERHLPEGVRETISAESGANDGLAVVFVMLPVLLLTESTGAALGLWAVQVMLWEVLGAVAIGAGLGYAAGRLLKWAERHHTIEQTSLLAYSLALSLVVLGLGDLVNSNGILAVFVAGRAFAGVVTVHERNEEERVQDAVNRFFLLPIFVFFGMVLPWGAWRELGWAVVALAVLLVVLRRLPAVWAMRRWMGVVRDGREAVLLGWFGPMGVAAIYYALHVERQVGPLASEVVWPVVSLVVAVSVVVYGVTAAPVTRWLSRERGV